MHHFAELAEVERLRSIADGLLRPRMHFHQQAVGANGYGGAAQRWNQAALTGGVAGIEDHRQVREFIEHGDGGDIARVARSAMHHLSRLSR